MDVSIIIVNYNTVNYVIDAIGSIFTRTKSIEYEIIVVDNNSDDSSKNILTKEYGDKVIYLSLPENIGFGRANNEGARIAKGQNLFFLNPDTILLNNAIKILSDYINDNPSIGCCGGNLVDKNENPTHSFLRYFPYSIFDGINHFFLKLPGKLLYGKNLFFNYTGKPLKVGYITGANLMIQKRLFDELGGFSKDFFMYYEETEMEFRIKKRGLSIVNVPSALIVHLEGKSFSNSLVKVKRIYDSRRIYLSKTKSRIEIRIIDAFYFLTILLRLILYSILRNKAMSTS